MQRHRQITDSNMQHATVEMLGLQETVRRLEEEKQYIIAEAEDALYRAEDDKERIREEATKERLRIIREAEIALRVQRASLVGSDQSGSDSKVPTTHSMS